LQSDSGRSDSRLAASAKKSPLLQTEKLKHDHIIYCTKFRYAFILSAKKRQDAARAVIGDPCLAAISGRMTFTGE